MAQTVKRLPAVWFYPWVWKIPWRRKWQPTPVLLPGKSHGRRTLEGHSPWGCKELDTTERLHFLSFLSLYYITCESIHICVQPQPYFPINPVIPNWQNHIIQPGASQVALVVKNQPANADVWHVGLIPGSGKSPGGGHDNSLLYSCLEEGMTIHSCILAWRIPWTEEPGRLQSIGLQRVGYDWVT